MRRAGKCLLPELLKRSGMTQRYLADKTGISYQQINDYYHGRRDMSIINAYLIAKALRCRMEDLYVWVRE